MSRQPRKEAALKRQVSKREPYDRVLIVCEGKKTEPEYFKDLKNHYRLNSANIEITPAARGSDPVSVVEHAKKLQEEEFRCKEKFDKVYCVFDRDEHQNFDAASDDLEKNRIELGLEPARSWPCFEFWLLLHFEYCRKAFPAKHCQSSLKKKLPEYTKGMQGIFAELFSRLDAGIKNAKAVQKDVLKSDAENPSTEVHKLVEYLKDLKN